MTYTVEINGVGVDISQLNIVFTIDHTLDYGNFVVRNNVDEAYDVGTMVDIDVSDGNDTLSYHFIIQSDNVDKLPNGIFLHTIDIIELTKILEWQTESVRTFTQPLQGEQLTMFDVVQRLQFSVPLVKESELTTTRVFLIEANTALLLRTIPAPEMVFNNRNLKEILFEVFDFIGAIPRLTKISNNIVLVADLYNKRRNLVVDNEFSSMEKFNLDGFSTALDADIKNLYDTYTDVVEPSINGFKKVSSTDGDFAEGTVFVDTEYPIVEVLEFTVKTDIFNRIGTVIETNIILDLTPYVLEKEEWEFLENINMLSDVTTSFRDNTLFFERFKAGVDGLFEEVGSFRGVAIVGGVPRIVLAMRRAAISQGVDMGTFGRNLTRRFSDYFQLEFRIKYKAQIDTRTEIKRVDTRRIKFESQSYTGQTDNVVRAERVLDRLFKMQQLLGNAEVMTGERCTSLSQLKELADYNAQDYIITTIELQFQKNYILAKYLWSQNYQKISEFIGLNSGIRLFDVPNDSYQRNIYVEDFVEINTVNQSNTSALTETGRNVFMNTIKPTGRDANNKPVRLLAFDNQDSPSIDTSTHTIIKSVSPYAGGNSINFHMEFKGQKVAGGQVGFSQIDDVELSLDSNDLTEEDYGVEDLLDQNVLNEVLQYTWRAVQGWWGAAVEVAERTFKVTLRKPRVTSIYYSDANGEIVDFSFQLINNATVAEPEKLPVIPKSSYASGNILVDSQLLRLHKDIREELAITYALHIMPAPDLEKTIIIGSYLAEKNNLIQFVNESAGQFEVFTSATPYEINENRFSRTSDETSALTYSITNNGLALNFQTAAAVWGIRLVSTNELVIAVNQPLPTTITTLFFNFKDKQSNVIYPAQVVTPFVRLDRLGTFGATATTTTSITLGWTDSNATTVEYHVEISENNRTYTRQTVTNTTATFTGLNENQRYYFRVRAVSATNFSEWSHVEVISGTPLPVAPVMATPFLVGGNPRRIRVYWENSEDDILGYVVEASENNTFSPLITGGLRSGIPGEEFTTYDNSNSDIKFSTEYFFRVKSFRIQGVFSASSNVVSITTPEIPKTSPPRITNVSVSGSTVSFKLINTYNLDVLMFANFTGSSYGSTIGLPVKPNESITGSLTFTTETVLFAAAQAFITGVAGSENATQQFASQEPPGTPSITSIVPNVGNNVVNWTYSGPFIDGFYLLRSPSLTGASEDVIVGYISPRIFRFVDFNVGSQISYTYRVVATNNIGIQASATSTVNSTTMTPTPPSLLTVTEFGFSSPEGDVLLQLNWQSNSAGAEDGFNLKLGSNIVGGTVRFVTKTDFVVNVPAGDTITFNFSVVAYNIYGDSAASNTASVTITG